MAMKLAVLVLAALAITSANENGKREVGSNLAEYFNNFQENMKPFIEGLTNFPNGVGSGSFPSFPGFGGSSGSGHQSPAKRQADSKTISEWFNQFGQGNFPSGISSGNLPFKPPFPFGNFGSSGSSQTSEQDS